MTGGLTELSAGVWELRVNLGRDPITGKRRTKSKVFRGGKREAQRALAAFVTAQGSRRAGSDETVAYLLPRYLDHLETVGRSPSTLLHYRRRADSVLIPRLGAISLRKLRASDLDDLYGALTKVGRKPSDVRQYHAIMRGALGKAKKWGWVETNVALDATPPKQVKKRVTPPPVNVVLELIELARAGTGHRNSPGSPEMACFLRLAACTGARRGELCGLQWQDFTADWSHVTVRRSVVDALGAGVPVVIKGTKTDSVRTVGLDPATMLDIHRHFQAMTAQAADFGTSLGPDSFVFSHEPGGSHPWRPEYVTLAWRRLCQHLGVDGVRLHDARHLAATLQIDAGVPLPTVSLRLGHAKTSTTSDIYVHARDERDADATEVMGRALGPGPAARQQSPEHP